MGIHVTIVTQLNSYATNQTNEANANGYSSKGALNYQVYFNDALN